METKQKQLDQLNAILREYSEATPRSKYSDLSDLGDDFALALISRSRAAIHQIAGEASPYVNQIEDIPESKRLTDFGKLKQIIGVVSGLTFDLENGYLDTLKQLVQAEFFADFLDMASHLLAEGYKDPAAVLVGSTLENHLKELCKIHNIESQIQSKDRTRRKSADLLNAELAKASVYSKLDQKSVTAWLDLRNQAAHGGYEQYNQQQVQLMLEGVRDFIGRTS